MSNKPLDDVHGADMGPAHFAGRIHALEQVVQLLIVHMDPSKGRQMVEAIRSMLEEASEAVRDETEESRYQSGRVFMLMQLHADLTDG